MIMKKALKKIWFTTLMMFLIIAIYTIPTIQKEEKVLRTNLEIKDITNLSTSKVYLKDQNNYLVKVDTFLEGKTDEEKIDKVIQYLTIDNEKLPIGLSGYIPKNTKILDLKIEGQSLYLNFSSQFLNTKNQELVITGLIYSIKEITSFQEIFLSVEGNPLQQKITGINKKYDLTSRDSINKVVIYYLENDEDSTYYVPVTKYMNDDREKIEIIIEELKNPKEDKLVSLVSSQLDLINYHEENNVMFLNFNEKLLDPNQDITDKVLNTIAYSVFENYDVNMVMFEINHENVEYRKR